MATRKTDTLTIGDLAQVGGTYTYYGRGTSVPLFPDLAAETKAQGKIAMDRGALFRDGARVAWRGLTLLDQGVDIQIDLASPAFVDRVVVRMAEGSVVAAAQVLVSDDGKTFDAAGSADGGVAGAIAAECIEIPVSVAASSVVLRLHANFGNIAIDGVEMFGCAFDQPVVYPQPRDARFGAASGSVALKAIKGIAIAEGASDDTRFAAEYLAGKIAEDFGVDLEVVEASGKRVPAGHLAMGTPREMKKLGRHKGRAPKAEGYRLEVARKAASLVARDRRGLSYGAETILALLRGAMDEPGLPACVIDDDPAMAIRGVHIGVPPREEIDFVKRLIRHVLVPMRYNTIFLEIAAGMRYDSHPEINEAWEEVNRRAKRGEAPKVAHGNMISGGSYLTKDEVRDLVDYARAHGIEVIPEVQSLSHVQFLTIAYPEIAEIPAKVEKKKGELNLSKEDERPARKYPHCYCALSEKAYEIQYDLIDEIVEVVRPSEFVHMGHDEVYEIGVCEKCRDHDPAELFALHVNRMHEYLAKKGLRMMIWADMLHTCTRYKTPPAIDMIPKDIVLLDFIWYFHLDKDIEPHLLDHGFQVVMGNMYSSHYPRYEARRKQKGVIGAEVSTWLREDEYTLGFEGKIYDFLYSAQMIWSEEYREALRQTYDRILTSMIPRIREKLRGQPFPSLAADAKFTPLALGKAADAAPVPVELEEATQELRGVPFKTGRALAVQSGKVRDAFYPSRAEVAVNRKADSLVFLHASEGNAPRVPWAGLTAIAEYVVEYADGKKVRVPVEYAGNIAPWNRRHAEPMPHPMYRHEGYIGTYLADPFLRAKTPSGGDVTLMGYEWLNPQPEKKIAKVTLRAKGDLDTATLLFGVTVVQTL